MRNQKFKQVCFLNGEFFTQEQAKSSVLEAGFLYGWGIFETMRSYRGNILYIEEHIKRLKKSSQIIDIKLPYPEEKIKSIVLKTVEINRVPDAHVRVNVWKKDKNSNIMVAASTFKPPLEKKYREGFKITISVWRQNEASPLSQIKSMNYLLYQLAYNQAKKKGFDEAVILNNRGLIAECSRANIFLIQDKTLFTPCLDCGCLPGITRKIVFDLAKRYGIKLQEGNLTAKELKEAEGSFITNSLIGIMPATYLDKEPIGDGRPNRLTRFLMAKYSSLLKKK